MTKPSSSVPSNGFPTRAPLAEDFSWPEDDASTCAAGDFFLRARRTGSALLAMLPEAAHEVADLLGKVSPPVLPIIRERILRACVVSRRASPGHNPLDLGQNPPFPALAKRML